MSAGSGIRHSEVNPSASMPVRLIQMWVLPDTDAIDPSYEQVDVDDQFRGDAARLTDAGAPDLTAGDSGAEVLIWATA